VHTIVGRTATVADVHGAPAPGPGQPRATGSGQPRAYGPGQPRAYGPGQPRAYGAVAWQVVDGEVRVAVVHRPRYDDWSLPKGKPEPGEAPEATAQREVAEETGASGPLGEYLGTTVHRVRPSPAAGSPPRPAAGSTDEPVDEAVDKVVGYWAMRVADVQPRRPDGEVDQVAWWTLRHAQRQLTYDQDRVVLARFAETVLPGGGQQPVTAGAAHDAPPPTSGPGDGRGDQPAATR